MPKTLEMRDVPACALAIVLGVDYAVAKMEPFWDFLKANTFTVMDCTRLDLAAVSSVWTMESPLVLVNFPRTAEHYLKLQALMPRILVASFNGGGKLPQEMFGLLNIDNGLMTVPVKENGREVCGPLQHHTVRMYNCEAMQDRFAAYERKLPSDKAAA